MGSNGRIIIPAALRRPLGLRDGSTVLLQPDDLDRIYLTSREGALRSAQQILSPYLSDYSVDDFLADRSGD